MLRVEVKTLTAIDCVTQMRSNALFYAFCFCITYKSVTKCCTRSHASRFHAGREVGCKTTFAVEIRRKFECGIY